MPPTLIDNIVAIVTVTKDTKYVVLYCEQSADLMTYKLLWKVPICRSAISNSEFLLFCKKVFDPNCALLSGRGGEKSLILEKAPAPLST